MEQKLLVKIKKSSLYYKMSQISQDTSNQFNNYDPENKIPNRIESIVIVSDINSSGRYIYSTFHSIMAIVAVYLSFKCNKGFNLGSFMVAFFCPYIYIIYILATRGSNFS
jgi:hypothetical protein